MREPAPSRAVPAGAARVCPPGRAGPGRPLAEKLQAWAGGPHHDRPARLAIRHPRELPSSTAPLVHPR